MSITIFGIASVYRLIHLYKDMKKEHGSSQGKEAKPVREGYIRVRVRNDLRDFDDDELFGIAPHMYDLQGNEFEVDIDDWYDALDDMDCPIEYMDYNWSTRWLEVVDTNILNQGEEL